MDLNSLIIFDKVAETASFTQAAKALKMPKSNVSFKINQLEDDLGIRLFERSTRNVRITEYGKKIRLLTQSLLDGVKEITSLAEDVMAEPKGNIRISAPYDIGFYLIQAPIVQFLDKYKDVSVELDLSNRYVDLIQEGFDLAIRASERALADSSLVATKLSATPVRFFAPAKTAFTRIKTIEELAKHPLITYRGIDAVVANGRKHVTLPSTARIRVNDMLSVKVAAMSGSGVGFLPEWMCRDDLAAGRLVKILPDWSGAEANFHVVYPTRRMLPPKTRVFIEHLRSWFENSCDTTAD